MEQEHKDRPGIMGSVAKALNFTGSALVASYDSTSNMLGKVFSKVKTITPSLPGTAMDFFSDAGNFIAGGFRKLKTDEELDIEKKIDDYKNKIKSAYYEIGKEGASAEKLESEDVQKLINDVKEYEKEIERLEGRVIEIEDLKKESVKSEERTLNKKVMVSESRALSSVSDAIEKAVSRGDFETDSDRAIFDKIAHDLLDNEMEIKILSSSELGKIGNKAAVPVLHEAIKFDNPYLSSEIINALINLQDPKSIKIFREMTTDPNYRVRLVSLRGLYKLEEDDEKIETVLINALKDSHPEVRKSAITFIGWKDYTSAVPGLIQTLQDKDEKVRQASVSALANIKDPSAVLPLMRLLADKNLDVREKSLEAIKMITGKDIMFNVELPEKALLDAINGLKEKWQSERLSQFAAVVDTGISEVKPFAKEEPVVTEEVEEALEEENISVEHEEDKYEEDVHLEVKPFAKEEPVVTEEVEEAPEEENISVEHEEDAHEDVKREAGFQELNEEVEATVENEAEYSESQLMKMNKAKLLSLCKERFIGDDTLTRAEIRNLILGKKG